MKPRILELREGILKKNDELARALRERFTRAGVRVVNLVSSPGSGKTLLLEATLRALVERGKRVAALTGDLQTDNDARRLARSGAPVRQISTGGTCHLEADMIERHLEGWQLDELDFLFIENVGNLVCTANFKIGANLAVVVASAPEGHDKPYKYPGMFATADVVVLNKADLLEVFEFDVDYFRRGLEMVNSTAPLFVVSSKKGQGMDEWLAWLLGQRELRRPLD